MAQFKFIFGDLNFRINAENTEVRQMIEQYFAIHKQDSKLSKEILRSLQDRDQLSLTKYNNEYLRNYREANINFVPTYKYEVNSDEYNKTKKLRTPSWYEKD